MLNLFHRAGEPQKVSPDVPSYKSQNLQAMFASPDAETLPRAVECYLSQFVGGGYSRLTKPTILRIAAQVLREADSVDIKHLEEHREYFTRNLEVGSHYSTEIETLYKRLQEAPPEEFIDILIDQAEWQAEMEFYGVFPERSIEVAMRYIKLSSLSEKLTLLCQTLAPEVEDLWTVVVRVDNEE